MIDFTDHKLLVIGGTSAGGLPRRPAADALQRIREREPGFRIVLVSEDDQ